MANGLGIDFNPEPAYGSNPFEPVQQGINLGLGLQRAQMEQQKFQQDSEMEREKMKLLKFGQLADLYDKTKSEDLRKLYYNGTLRPLAKQGLGVDLPEQADATLSNIMNGVAESYQQLKKGSIDEKQYAKNLQDLYTQATISRDKEAASQIENLIKVGKKTGGAKQVPGRVTDTGLPLFFDSELRQFGFNDPSTQEFTPYFGQQFPAQANPSTGAETELREIKRQRSLGSKIISLMTPDKLGVIDKRFKSIGNYFENSTDVEAEQFKTIASIADTIARNNFYGATLTDNEQRAFQDIAYNRNLSPSAFVARVRTVVSAQDELEEALRSAASAANRPFRDQNGKRNSASDNSDLATMSDEELQAIAAGQK